MSGTNLDLAKVARRNTPLLPIRREDGNRLLVVARNYTLDPTSSVGLKENKLADTELEHGMVGPRLPNETQTLNNTMVEVYELFFAQTVDVDGHGDSDWWLDQESVASGSAPVSADARKI